MLALFCSPVEKPDESPADRTGLSKVIGLGFA